MSSLLRGHAKELPRTTSPLGEITPFGLVRLVAFDLDGTLLRDTTAVPGQRFSKLQRSNRAYGVRITLATGRTLWGARPAIEALGGLKGVPVILYNGSIVVDSEGRLLQRRTIAPTSVAAIVRTAAAKGVSAFVYEFRDSVIYSNSGNISPETVYLINNGKDVREFNGMTPIRCSSEELGNVQPSAILILPSDSNECHSMAVEFASLPGVSVTSSGGRYIEIRPFGVSKAEGIRILANALAIHQNEVLAVGDNDNDVELMTWAHLSVAVKGASVAACGAATHLSRNGPEQAAIEVLDLVRQARRLNKGGRKNDTQR